MPPHSQDTLAAHVVEGEGSLSPAPMITRLTLIAAPQSVTVAEICLAAHVQEIAWGVRIRFELLG